MYYRIFLDIVPYVQLDLYIFYIFFCHSGHLARDRCPTNNINQLVCMVKYINRGWKCLKQMNAEQAHGYVRQCMLTPYDCISYGICQSHPKALLSSPSGWRIPELHGT